MKTLIIIKAMAFLAAVQLAGNPFALAQDTFSGYPGKRRSGTGYFYADESGYTGNHAGKPGQQNGRLNHGYHSWRHRPNRDHPGFRDYRRPSCPHPGAPCDGHRHRKILVREKVVGVVPGNSRRHRQQCIEVREFYERNAPRAGRSLR